MRSRKKKYEYNFSNIYYKLRYIKIILLINKDIKL